MTLADVRVYPNIECVSEAAAAAVAEVAVACQCSGRVSHIAVSGGKTPERLFRRLAAPPYGRALPWSGIHLWMVDERPVPADHADSNYRLLREALLERVPIHEGNVHPVPVTGHAPDDAAHAYEASMKSVFADLPRFDLVLLGMGADGHTASLFPHSPALSEQASWAVANPVEKLGVSRITLTYPVLNNAARVLFIVSGADKADALALVLYGPRDVESLPAQAVEPTGGTVVWYVDRLAAARLPLRR